MALVALVVLVVVALVIAVGVHTGPHGLVAAGTLGIAASIGFVVGIIAILSISTIAAVVARGTARTQAELATARHVVVIQDAAPVLFGSEVTGPPAKK